MTQEDKELLLKDLCARLPYHPILNWKFLDNTSRDDELTDLSDLNIWWITKAKDCEVRPYLRPMSSMTEEERKELLHFGGLHISESEEVIDVSCVGFERHCEIQDWLNAHHFDYRNLIEKGLAIEAPEGMYNHYDEEFNDGYRNWSPRDFT